MKKTDFLQRGFLWALATLGGVMTMATSCVNDTLDLEKELELEVNLGGSITVPLGYLEPILLGDMLDTDDIELLETMEGGDYKVTVADNINFDLSSLSDHGDVVISGVDGSETSSSLFNIPSVGSGYIAIDGYQFDLDDISTTIKESIEIPVELSEILSMNFASDVYLTLDIKVEIDGADDCALKLDDYTIALPKFLKFADGTFTSESDITLSEDNLLTINSQFEIVEGTDGKSYRQFSHQFQIVSIDLSDPTYSDVNTLVGDKRIFAIDEQIFLSGALSLGAGNINLDEVSPTVKSTVTYHIDDMTIDKVYGLFTPDLESGSEEFDLSDLVDALDGDLSLILADPTIKLTATNSLDIPIQIDKLTLVPTKNGEVIYNTMIDGAEQTTVVELKEPVVIDAANDGEPSVTTIMVTGYDSDDQDGVKYAQLPNFSSILMGMPDKISMEYGASVLTTQTHMVDLSRDADDPYYFALDYDLDIPLSFDWLELDYTAKVSDLGDSLGDVLEVVSALNLLLEIEHTIPLSLNISAITPLDAEGNTLSALDSFIVGGTASIAANGSSSVELQISDNEAGDLSLVDSLEIDINASISNSDIVLNAEQSLTIKVSASLPEGITLNLGE